MFYNWSSPALYVSDTYKPRALCGLYCAAGLLLFSYLGTAVHLPTWATWPCCSFLDTLPQFHNDISRVMWSVELLLKHAWQGLSLCAYPQSKEICLGDLGFLVAWFVLGFCA